MVPAMKRMPVAVLIVPPMFGVPVDGKPRAFRSSKTPSGTRQATSAVSTSRATSSPNGGAEQGTLVCGSQKRP